MGTMLPVKNYLFDDYQLDMEGENGLIFKGEPLNLAPKELSVLKLLVSLSGQLVTKDSILDSVWKDQDIGEESLTRCVYILRQRLKKGLIKTIYGKGYKFVAEVKKSFVGSNDKTITISQLDIVSVDDNEVLIKKYHFSGYISTKGTLTANQLIDGIRVIISNER